MNWTWFLGSRFVCYCLIRLKCDPSILVCRKHSPISICVVSAFRHLKTILFSGHIQCVCSLTVENRLFWHTLYDALKYCNQNLEWAFVWTFPTRWVLSVPSLWRFFKTKCNDFNIYLVWNHIYVHQTVVSSQCPGGCIRTVQNWNSYIEAMRIKWNVWYLTLASRILIFYCKCGEAKNERWPPFVPDSCGFKESRKSMPLHHDWIPHFVDLLKAISRSKIIHHWPKNRIQCYFSLL